MKPLLLISIPLLAIFSCSKNVENVTVAKQPGLTFSKSYAVVKCDSCRVIYKGPGKQTEVKVTGTSPDLNYKYLSGDTLEASIYPLDHQQDIIYTVYNPNGRVVYSNVLDQSTDDSWDVNVLLP